MFPTHEFCHVQACHVGGCEDVDDPGDSLACYNVLVTWLVASGRAIEEDSFESWVGGGGPGERHCWSVVKSAGGTIHSREVDTERDDTVCHSADRATAGEVKNFNLVEASFDA